MESINYQSHPYDVRLELDKMVKRREIKRYMCETHREMGIVFYVETDQGWSPDPFWQQWQIEDYFLHDAQ